MKIFVPIAAEGFELAQPVDEEDFFVFQDQINGTMRAGRWTPIAVKLVNRCPEHGTLQPADAPWFGIGELVLKRKAVEVIGSFLRDYGELLPLRCHETDLFVFNSTVVLDALDEKTSEIGRFKDGRVMAVWRYGFRPDVVADAGIFKVTTVPSGQLFFSERAVRIWTDSGVTGVDFDEVWRYDPGT